jgi:hypothetical protein
MIQVVMRQCLMFSDLLFARDFPREPASLATLLLDGRFMPLYFSAIVAACAVPIAIVVALRNIPAEGAAAFARGLLAFLAAVQVLLLPITYGVLIVDKTLLRVGAFGAKKPLSPGDEASLEWEGKDGLARTNVTETEILAFDPILPTIFGGR